MFLGASAGKGIRVLAGHLESGKIKPVIDGVWDLQNDHPEDGGRSVFQRLLSDRTKSKCIIRMVTN